jgi:hypothetical protein
MRLKYSVIEFKWGTKTVTTRYGISFFLLLIFSSFLSLSKDQYRPSRGEGLVNTTLGKAMRIIKKKYNIRPSGSGAAMPGGPIRELTLCFDAKNLTKEKLREFLIKFSQELLDQVNANEEIQQFLATKPFTIKNVEVIIFNQDKYGNEIYDPGISIARISNGILIYRTTDRNERFKYKNEFEEAYEEALKVLNESKPESTE